jgi:hypothetical protein
MAGADGDLGLHGFPDRWGYPRIVVETRRVGQAVLATGVALTLGRWPWHWRHDLLWAVLAAIVVAALAAGVWSSFRVAALRVAVALCLVDAAITVRAWSARSPLHCDCVRRTAAPALAGWGGTVIAADVLLCALAVWLTRPVRERTG